MKWAIFEVTLTFLFSNETLEGFPCLLLFVCGIGICINMNRETKFYVLEFTYYNLFSIYIRLYPYM